MKKILLCFFIQLRGVFLKISYLCGRHPKVLSIKDSLSYILKHRISISRYGDGEILLMEGYPIGFQKEDAALATRLREIARNPIPQHRVCIPDVFSGISSYNKESRKFWKDFLFRGNGLTLFNKYFQSGPYLNTQISRFYEHLKDKMTFLRIAFPMAKSTIATLCIFCFMNVWNDYFTPLIYINDARKYTLPLGLASMKGMYSTDWPVLMASSVIAVLPVLIAFLCAQDAFVKGVMMSGMKD